VKGEKLMITIDELLRSKVNKDIYTITPDDTVYQALELMAEKDIGALPVVKDNKLVGFFSERDYARKIILKGKCSLDTPVGEIMATTPITITPDHSVEECMAIMTERRIRHLMVLERSKLVGIVSMRDLVEAIIKAEEDRITRLEDYIVGQDYGH
jgi:CBS domain-containing protein